MTVTLPKNPRIRMRAVIALVAGRDPVTLKKIWIYGYPVAVC
jgi:hypothetical protein